MITDIPTSQGETAVTPAVSVHGLRRTFGDRTVLDGVDLELAPGEFVALLGRSGSGKSTFLRALAGLDDSFEGRALVPRRRAVVFQDARLLPWTSVLDNVLLGLDPARDRERAREVLAEVGLGAHEDAWPRTLSGGEAQRAALARALVRAPDLLLLDEPFGALDALTRIRMHVLVRQLWSRHRPATLLVTHDVDEAILLADRVLVLTDGRFSLDVPVTVDLPRHRGDRRFIELRSRLLGELGVDEDAPGPDLSPTHPSPPCKEPSMTITEPRVAFDVRPLSGAIGAEIRGLDIRNLDDDTVAQIRRIWLERKVVFFPDAHLSPDEHLEFAARFGEPTEGHPVVPGIEGRPEVFEIDYSVARDLYSTYGDVSTYERGVSWHTDVTFVARPPLGSILNAVAIPSSGGDTLFSNQVAAFEGLSPALQEFLVPLRAVHDGTRQFKGVLDLVGEGTWEGERFTTLEPTEHPVVRTHPETGERALFVNPGFTSRIVGLSLPESDALLGFLYQHSVRPEYTVRYHWTQGTIAFWDNRVTQHAVVGDFGDQHRAIQRITLRGDVPV